MKKKWNDRAERFCAIAVCVLTAGIMLWFWCVSLASTQTFWEIEAEAYTDAYMPRVRDGIKGNILFLVVMTALLVMICKAAEKWIKQWHVAVLLVAEMVAVIAFSWIYVRRLGAVQWGDFYCVVDIAGQILEGNYSQFAPGSYLATYPHQIGLCGLVMFLIRLVGETNVVPAFQSLNCLCAGGILLCGYRAVHAVWNRKELDVVYLLVQGLCLPLYFYTPLVYGEIISILLILISITQLGVMLREQKIIRWRALVMLLCTGFAVCFRKNTLIVLIAMCIVILVTVLKNRKWRLGVLIAMLVVSACAPSLYQKVRYGKYDQNAAMPSVLWIYMGMLPGSGWGPGAFDGKAAYLFADAEYNPEVAKEMAKEAIAERMDEFKENPEIAWEFLKEKILWQWEAPCFMSFSNTRIVEDGYPKGIAYEINMGKLREPLADFMDSYQSFAYFAFLAGAVGMLLKKERFTGHIWAIIFLGGFFFSAIWEAKTRYTYPYFVMMMPLCAYGIYFMKDSLSLVAARVIERIKGNRRNEDVEE